MLKPCNALEMIEIVDAEGYVDLEKTENDVFVAVVEWLSSCKNLRIVHFTSVVSAPAILTQISRKSSSPSKANHTLEAQC